VGSTSDAPTNLLSTTSHWMKAENVAFGSTLDVDAIKVRHAAAWKEQLIRVAAF
jgi:hypothetical protein